MPKFPARVHPILARKANTAVIIRRGPSKSVCTMLWDRTRDTFMPGQWLRGRIYERRCDLSPDGRHFIYFAMNGKWGGPLKGSWTAISRAPYLKALALWPWGDCWNGGGLFLTDSRFWRNAGCHCDEPESGTTRNHPEWEWAELDRKRLVWVTKGVLHAARIHGKGLGDAKVLHEFKDMELEALAAPY